MHLAPARWRTGFVKNHLPAEGAWWLRDRVENKIPVHFGATVTDAREAAGSRLLRLRLANGRKRAPAGQLTMSSAGVVMTLMSNGFGFIEPELRCAH